LINLIQFKEKSFWKMKIFSDSFEKSMESGAFETDLKRAFGNSFFYLLFFITGKFFLFLSFFIETS
jgi:hypothetical protein